MSTLFDLTGLVAVVSGGSGWLGAPMTKALLEAKAEVFVVARDIARAEKILSSENCRLHLLEGDVTRQSWPEAIKSVTAQCGRIDVLINNAHVGRGGSLRSSTRDHYLEAFDLAVVGAAEGMKAAYSGMRSSVALGGSPSVINIASMYGLVAPDFDVYNTEEARNPPFYGAAKAAMLQLTRYAAAEYGSDGIRVNAIAPGPFPAPAAQENSEFVNALANKTMLGRVGRPEEIASTVIYLASQSSSFVTGTTVSVDGGWTAR